VRYRSKPQEVEAIRWTGHNYEELLTAGMPVEDLGEGVGLVLLAGAGGAQGRVPVPVGHYIVRKPNDFSDHWPVDPDYFQSKYERLALEGDKS